MGKWTKKSLVPPAAPDAAEHVAVEDLARLAEGTVGTVERVQLLRHINCCQQCYEILHLTLQQAPLETPMKPAAQPWWKTKAAYALAAAMILIFVIGGQFVFEYLSRAPRFISATVDLDQNLRDVLLADDALRFGEGARLTRLLAALQQKGIDVKHLKLAVLAKPYYQKKSLFGPREVLHIRIENDVAYLVVAEVQ
jgi:hypothetical protein